MLHFFKLNGHRAAYDCAHRVYSPLSPLSMKIAECVTPPLPGECPSALRYTFAKYDSSDLSEAYGEVSALYDRVASSNEPKIDFYSFIQTSSSMAEMEIEDALAHGIERLYLYVKNATLENLQSLTASYSSKMDLHLIADSEAFTAANAECLNAMRCYIKAPAGGKTVDSVLALCSQGFRFIDADISASPEGIQEAVYLAREFERLRDAGFIIDFAPFTLALMTESGYDTVPDACSECWAREMCRGSILSSSGEKSSACALRKTLMECAVILQHEC